MHCIMQPVDWVSFSAAPHDDVELCHVAHHVTKTAPILFIHIHCRHQGHVVTYTERRRPLTRAVKESQDADDDPAVVSCSQA